MITNIKIRKCVAVYFLLQFSLQTFLPTLTYALTSGPAQPEFSSFEPVATTNMVNEFTGDFTYNLPIIEVPGPNGSSYPLSLSYHSGVTPEEEASWVGYGWTLNPGAINRNTRGLPDDYKGQQVTFHNKMPKNWTATVGGGAQFGEIFDVDLAIGVNASLRYNNYRGFGYNAGVGVTVGKGLVSLGYHVDNGESSYSLNVSPAAILNYTTAEHADLKGTKSEQFYDRMDNIKNFERFINMDYSKFGATTSSAYGIFTFAQSTKPNIIQPYSGASYTVSIGVEGNPFIVPIGGTVNIWGSYTWQKNDDAKAVGAYGYMYSANAGVEDVMDYHVEKETDFNKRDVFLGVPFNNADNFMVTGEGLGGGFRMYNSKTGHFGPRKFTSDMDIFNVGGEIAAGWTFGAGLDIGVGKNTFAVTDWDRPSAFNDPANADLDEPVVFRFNNDLGGQWGINHDDKPVQATVSGRNFSLPSEQLFEANNGERTGRSSYIGFHTNKEMTDRSYTAYNKNSSVNSMAQRSVAAHENLIGEMAVFNEAGSRYVYGLPVYNRNEKSRSYGVSNAATSNIFKNYFIYDTNDGKTEVGEDQLDPYASTYLLTEITTPDFADRQNDGPTQDDFGGYTRFNYKKQSSGDGWYKWRAPFRGLIYSKNSHSDPQDDLGTYSEGEKEIYYLESIETKTHVAFFRLSPREDSREAPASNELSQNATAGSFVLSKLDKIELYSVEDCAKQGGLLVRDPQTGNPEPLPGAKPVKTVHFRYDYSLCGNLPNSSAGKLTLKSVFFEYNGISRTQISPYQFTYGYPDYGTYPSKYTSGGEDVTENYATLASNAAMQNPPYSEFSTDPWGNYWSSEVGQAQFDRMRSWIDQNEAPNITFDPAAWNLKVIKLPSGGQIHIQYEQDDYSYVQDQEAHVMAYLDPGGSESGTTDVFTIDPSSVGVTTIEDVDLLVEMIIHRYMHTGKKIYFKFLYQLIDVSSSVNPNSCNAEFISGYATITACSRRGNKIQIQVESGQRLPQQVCEDFVKTNRLGKLDPSTVCNPSVGMNDGEPESIVRQLHTMINATLVPGSMCQRLSQEDSYFRIPALFAKKGGGLRVKRLMMYGHDPEGQPVLYGNEYLYETENEDGRTISSGVATNEPPTIREENVLVDFIARKDQRTWSRIVAGKDKKQSEGPLGESILPGASVGYSRVVVKNIHSGNTTPGYSISEFFTAKDYPVRLAHPGDGNTMTPILTNQIEKKFSPGILVNIVKDKTVATQGFSFVLNSMHGQMKGVSSCSGTYTGGAPAEASIVSYTKYTYFEPEEEVPMMSGLRGGIVYRNPGREVDLTFAQRSVTETSNDFNMDGDFQMTIIPLLFIIIVIPYPMAIPSYSYVEGELSTHAVSKVVRYPAIVKSIETSQNGMKHIQQHIAFDEFTGKPVAVKSYDEFNGGYLSQNIPAGWEYTALTGKWKDEGRKVSGDFSFDGQYLTIDGDACTLAEFMPGDKIELGRSTGNLYHVVSLDAVNSRVQLAPSLGGVSAPSEPDEIKIISSGKTNQLSQQAGNITSFSENPATLTVPVVSEVNRYEENSFVQALQAETANVTGEGQFTLPGEYQNMDMSAFADKITDCPVDLRNATIREVDYTYKLEGNELIINLMSFDVYCGGETWLTIAGEYWE